MHNIGRSGLTFWSPNVNIFRDPRWGRGQETPGEDPYLSSTFATFYVRGLQEVDALLISTNDSTSLGPSRLKVSSCCKHMTAYDVDNWNGIDRYHFDAQVTAQDLADTFNPPFQSCVEDGHVSSVMCSYNRVNGVPTCADYNLLTNTVRNSWSLNGYIVSDCDAVRVLFDDTNYAATAEDAVADVLRAGMDLNCGSFLAEHGLSAVTKGKITEADVNTALSNLLTVQMRLGLFDGDPTRQPYGELGPKDVCTNEHQQLALEAAQQGIVLLKNDANILPLSSSKFRTLAVIGPNANVTNTMIGNYAGIPCKYITPLAGLQSYATTLYAQGCANVACKDGSLINAATNVASEADATILIIGLDQSQEAETLDRTSLLLPGQQQQLIYNVLNATTNPVVIVIMAAGPIDVSFAKTDPRVSGILWVGYPGQAGGAAIAQVIFGDYNPGGRLPVTWYPQSFTQISMVDMHMRPNEVTGYPGRTYRFYTGPTVYHFGEGLSYTNYSYGFSSAPAQISVSKASTQPCSALQIAGLTQAEEEASCFHIIASDASCSSLKFQVGIKVSNTGSMDGSHAVLLFAVPPAGAPSDSPKKQLIGFRSVHVKTGTERKVSFNIRPCKDLSTAREDGERVLLGGTHTLSVGDAQFRLPVLSSLER
ncbi:hypothetical protein O6H91_14G038400 [Diphasiastrum complanatum]|nr:hypothetical protein O6H91_14G038400 [Diphasiastrum complanatum]